MSEDIEIKETELDDETLVIVNSLINLYYCFINNNFSFPHKSCEIIGLELDEFKKHYHEFCNCIQLEHLYIFTTLYLKLIKNKKAMNNIANSLEEFGKLIEKKYILCKQKTENYQDSRVVDLKDSSSSLRYRFDYIERYNKGIDGDQKVFSQEYNSIIEFLIFYLNYNTYNEIRFRAICKIMGFNEGDNKIFENSKEKVNEEVMAFKNEVFQNYDRNSFINPGVISNQEFYLEKPLESNIASDLYKTVKEISKYTSNEEYILGLKETIYKVIYDNNHYIIKDEKGDL